MRPCALRRVTRRAGSLLLLLPALWLPRLHAQDTSSSMPMSAGLLKRLAAAVDGHRTGTPVWVTADTAFPYRVWAISDYPDSARYVGLKHEGSVTFGPYYARTDGGSQEAFIVQPCWKDQYTQWHCPDSTASTRTDNVLSVSVTVETRDHRTYTTRVGPDVEAVFFTLSGIDRLLLPYYTAMYGPEFALRQRQAAQRLIGKAEPRQPSGNPR